MSAVVMTRRGGVGGSWLSGTDDTGQTRMGLADVCPGAHPCLQNTVPTQYRTFTVQYMVNICEN